MRNDAHCHVKDVLITVVQWGSVIIRNVFNDVVLLSQMWYSQIAIDNMVWLA